MTLEFIPAAPDHGIVFERMDLSTPVRIPALIDNVIQRPRCTVLSANGSSIAVVEHVMAALAGLHIDNCLVRMNAPEPPIGDGSSRIFVEALLSAGVCGQDRLRDCLLVSETLLCSENDCVGVAVQPAINNEYEIGFLLNYPAPIIGKQSYRTKITAQTFVDQLADCRTFILEEEIQQIQASGIGLRATPQNVLVFSKNGPVENTLRAVDECVKHKILDCVGDFALLGCDLQGRFTANQSGHRHNHDIIRKLRTRYLSHQSTPPAAIRVAG